MDERENTTINKLRKKIQNASDKNDKREYNKIQK